MASLDEIRDAKLRLLEAEIAAKMAEANYGALKVEEAERAQRLERATPGEDNTLLFSHEITGQSVAQAIRTMDIWSRRSPGAPMTVLFDSPGGNVMAGFRLYDFLNDLRRRGHKLTIKVYGGAFSWGAGLLQAADDRVMSPNAFLIIHELQLSDIEGNYTEIFREYKERVDRFQGKYFDIVAQHSTMSVKQVRNKCRNKDWMLDAEEAVKYGFADRIE